MFRKLFKLKKAAFYLVVPFALYSMFVYKKVPILNATTQQVQTSNNIVQKIPDSSQQAKDQANKQKIQKFMQIKKISQIPEFKFTQKPKRSVIIADLPYNPQFQQRILKNVKAILKVSEAENIDIYRANILDPQVYRKFKQNYNTEIKEETIVLIKNQYQDTFINIDFDIFVQHPKIMKIYMDKITWYNKQNQSHYLNQLKRMGPNQTFLIYVYDQTQPIQQQLKRKLTAKYIQMELALHSLDSIKVFPVESSVLKNNKIVEQSKARVNSLHLIRKHNQFTYSNPNLSLKIDQNNDSILFHIVQDFGLHNKKGQITIQNYLSRFQTFNSTGLATPYVIVLTIDKNKISTTKYNKLMQAFRTIKRQNKFPQVGMILKFGQTGYQGLGYNPNNQFNIRMTNIAQLDNQTFVHEIKNLNEAKQLQINQDNWLTRSFQYQYHHLDVTTGLVQQFMKDVLQDKVSQFYRSDLPDVYNHFDNLSGKDFDTKIIQNEKDHIVLQYDNEMATKKFQVQKLNLLSQLFMNPSISQQMSVFKLNKTFNSIPNQLFSPNPRLTYYKNEWKKDGPITIPLQLLKKQSLLDLYKMCHIIKQLKTVDVNKVQKNISQSKKWKKQQFQL